MKLFTTIVATSLLATQVAAGGLADAIVETPVQEEPMAAATGSSEWIIPLVILGTLIAVAAQGSSSSSSEEEPNGEVCEDVPTDSF